MKISKSKYIVKDVLKFQIKDGEEYFLVWWQGFRRGEATWEPMKNMIFLKDYQDYYHNLKQKYLLEKYKNKSIKSLSQTPRKLKKLEQNHQDSQLELQIKKSKLKDKKTKIINKNCSLNSLRSMKYFLKNQEAILSPKKSKSLTSLKINNRLSEQNLMNKQINNDHLKVRPQDQQKQDLEQQQIKQNNNQKIPISLNPSHVTSLVQNNSFGGLIKQKINLTTRSPIFKLKQSNKNQKFLKLNFHSMRFQVRVKQSKNIPFWQQFKSIKGAFYKDGQLMYEVQFQNNKCNEPILVHEYYLKLLWPQRYYEYLNTKVQE